MEERYLININRVFFLPRKVNYTFFSNAHRAFSKIDYKLGHKIYLYKLKRIDFVSTNFLDHYAMKI